MGEFGAAVYELWRMVSGQRRGGTLDTPGEIDLAAVAFIFDIYKVSPDHRPELLERLMAFDGMVVGK